MKYPDICIPGGNWVPTMPECMYSKLKGMGACQLQMSEMSEKISIKMGVKFTASLNMGPIFYFTTHITSGQKK